MQPMQLQLRMNRLLTCTKMIIKKHENTGLLQIQDLANSAMRKITRTPQTHPGALKKLEMQTDELLLRAKVTERKVHQ